MGTDTREVLASNVSSSVRLLTLNRPAKLNALTLESTEMLLGHLEDAEADEACSVVVLTGAGRGFCSGWDLDGADENGLTGGSAVGGMRAQRRTAGLIRRLRTMTVPVIAAVNGAAAGGGFSLALACDIRVASPAATFHPRFIKLGISGGDLGASWLLPRAIGASRASELLLTGRDLGAEEAERIGLVSVLSEDAVAGSLDIAHSIASHAPFAIGLTKEVLWASQEIPSLYVAMELENRTQILATTTRDHVEAVRAQREKRAPAFTNS